MFTLRITVPVNAPFQNMCCGCSPCGLQWFRCTSACPHSRVYSAYVDTFLSLLSWLFCTIFVSNATGTLFKIHFNYRPRTMTSSCCCRTILSVVICLSWSTQIGTACVATGWSDLVALSDFYSLTDNWTVVFLEFAFSEGWTPRLLPLLLWWWWWWWSSSSSSS